jgi:hypothetical protein
MGWTCSAHRKNGNLRNFFSQEVKERDHLRDTDVDGSMLLQ